MNGSDKMFEKFKNYKNELNTPFIIYVDMKTKTTRFTGL